VKNNRLSAWFGGAIVCGNLLGCGGGGEEDGPDQPQTYSITATVTGLSASGLVLQNSGTSIPIASGATSASVASGVSSGASYSVTVQTQPTGLTCTVANGSGTISGNVNNVTVTCVATNAAYTISGTIAGYTGSGLALRLNNQTTAAFNASPGPGASSFQFTAGLTTGTAYGVSVVAQPTSPTQFCVVNSGGSGTIGTSNVSNVAVACALSNPYRAGGAITGLTGAGLSLGMLYTGSATPATLAVAANATSYTFPETIEPNGIFQIGILTQPAGQTCTVVRGRGLSVTDVTDVNVACINKSGNTLTGTYTLLDSAGRQYLQFNADGTFTSALRHNDPGCNTATDTRNGNGAEYGTFAWNQTNGAFLLPAPPVVDSNGQCGLADAGTFADSFSGPLTKSGNSLTVGTGGPTLTAIVGANPAASVVGAFVREAHDGSLLVLHADNTFLYVETQGRGGLFFNTQERGCYTVAGTEITFSVGTACLPDGLASYDFNGPYGFGPFAANNGAIGPMPITLESASVLVLNGVRFVRSLPN
jgi:hypothetical protein